MKISLTGSLLGIAALALAGLGVAVVVLDSELTAQNAVVDKQVIQLANKQLEVNGLASEVYQLSKQADDFAADQMLTADLNTQHQQSEETINDQHLVVMINSNELKVTEHAWANTALPDAAGQLLYKATGSTNYHRDKDSQGTTSIQLSTIGLRTAAL